MRVGLGLVGWFEGVGGIVKKDCQKHLPRYAIEYSGWRHSVQMILACVLSLAIFRVLLQSWELCLVLLDI